MAAAATAGASVTPHCWGRVFMERGVPVSVPQVEGEGQAP